MHPEIVYFYLGNNSTRRSKKKRIRRLNKRAKKRVNPNTLYYVTFLFTETYEVQTHAFTSYQKSLELYEAETAFILQETEPDDILNHTDTNLDTVLYTLEIGVQNEGKEVPF